MIRATEVDQMKRATMLGLFVCVFFVALSGAHGEDLFFDSDGVKIRYTVQGEGEPVVLIHGFSADIESNWGMPGIITALSENYRVIGMDVRGHGKSGKPHGSEHYGIKMVDDVVRLLDHLKIEKAHVVGYSMGGIITLRLQTLHPDRLLSAVPAGAGWSPPEGPVSEFADTLAESLEQGNGITPLIEMLTPPDQPKQTPEQLKVLNDLVIARNDVLALASAVRGFRELTVPLPELQANSVPTLAIIGELDPMKIGVDAMEMMMPNLKVVVVEGADHMTAFMNPTFISALKEFLADPVVKQEEAEATEAASE